MEPKRRERGAKKMVFVEFSARSDIGSCNLSLAR